MQEVRQVQQEVAQLAANPLELDFEALRFLADARHFRQQRRRILALPFRDADLARQRIAPGLQVLRACLDVLALALERLEAGAIQGDAAPREAVHDGIEIGAKKIDVEHARILAEGFYLRALRSLARSASSFSRIRASRPRSVGSYQLASRIPSGKYCSPAAYAPSSSCA